MQAGWGAVAASSAAGFLLRQPRGLGVVDGAGRPQKACLKVEPHRSPRGVLMPSGSLRPFRQSPQTCLSQQCSQAVFLQRFLRTWSPDTEDCFSGLQLAFKLFLHHVWGVWV